MSRPGMGLTIWGYDANVSAMTQYRLANNPGDYSAAHKLLRDEGLEGRIKLGWPTVTAWRDGTLIGVLSTNSKNGAIVAGPLGVRKGIDARVAINLIELYDVIMRAAGVTHYTFLTEGDETLVERGVRRYYPNMKPYSTKDNRRFYVKELT
jgi:hypothetical protein